MDEGTRRGLAWWPAAVTVALAGVTVWLVAREGAPPAVAREVDVVEIVPAAVFAGAGIIVARARSRNSIGWLLLLCGLLSTLLVFAEAYGYSADGARPRWPLAIAAFWLATWAWVPPLLLPATVLLIRYPSGSPPTPRWRLLDRLLAVGLTALTAGLAFAPNGVDDFRTGLTNPVGVSALSTAGFIVGAPLLLVGVPLCLAGTVRRVLRASAPERQQLAWLVGTVLPTLVFSFVFQGSEVVFLVGLSIVPVSIALGVLRYRLLDIDIVLRRGLVYGILTAGVAIMFATTTALSATVLSERTRTVVVAAVIAVGLVPARDRLQRSVDRFVYGDRREPMRALERLGRDVADIPADSLVRGVLATVSGALRIPGCEIVDPQGRLVASQGTGSGPAPALEVALAAGGAPAGRLRVAPRNAQERLDGTDRQLLATLAPQVAIVVRAVQLADDLELARRRAVAARAEERRRLRQDLHDGLGPSLSGVALGLEAAQALVDPAAGGAGPLLVTLRTEIRAAVDEVRRIIDDLRPRALDDADLLEALREHASITTARAGGLVVTVDSPPSLPLLPPDVEVAALRIATEAITNVVRHSGAQQCRVSVTCEDCLVVVVADDGRGMDAGRPSAGVGIGSMRDRADAVGGSLTVASGPGGTTITARLPAPEGRP